MRKRLEAANTLTFKECAEAYVKAHRVGWRNPKHAAQWQATLATYAEPHTYDLCEEHAQRLTAPRGWEVVRHDPDPAQTRVRSSDDLEALADAVREAARPERPRPDLAGTSGRRGHLRALPTPS